MGTTGTPESGCCFTSDMVLGSADHCEGSRPALQYFELLHM